MSPLRKLLRSAGLKVAHTIGARIVDQSGRQLGRALIIPWRGKIHVVGLEVPLSVHWEPQKRLTYWKQEIGFATHASVDFPNVVTSERPDAGATQDEPKPARPQLPSFED